MHQTQHIKASILAGVPFHHAAIAIHSQQRGPQLKGGSEIKPGFLAHRATQEYNGEKKNRQKGAFKTESQIFQQRSVR